MAERPDPDTDPNTLADRLDARADKWESLWESISVDAEMDRAAADGLRRLDAIDRTWDGYTLQPKDVTDRVERTRLLARGQIAASLSPTPTPDSCPTCGSRSREMAVTGSACDPWTGSPDAWHDSGQP